MKAISIFWWTFFLVRFIFKGISFVKLKAISFFWWKLRKCHIKGISEKLVFNDEYIAEHTPWLVLHVLHFIGDFFYKTRPSLARAAFIRDFLNNQKGNLLQNGGLIECWAIPAIVMDDDEVKVNEFLVLYFFSISDILKWGSGVTATLV